MKIKTLGRPTVVAALIAIAAAMTGTQTAQAQAAAPKNEAEFVAWFSEQSKPVVAATNLFQNCTAVANTIANQKAPADYYSPAAMLDHTHNQAVTLGHPDFKGLSLHPLTDAHQRYANFLKEGEARLKSCGTDLGAYTTRMSDHISMLGSAMEAAEGKMAPEKGQQVLTTLNAYSTAQQNFIAAISNLSNDKYLQGEMHQAIVHVIQQTTPPAPKNP